MSPKEFEDRLLSLDPEADEFPLWIDELIANVPRPQHKELIPAIFKYVEAHPDFSNGAPGAMVHFIEGFYPSYKALLLESLARSPSQMCVLMVSRILNSRLEPSERDEYASCLVSVQNNSNAAATVREEAKDFLEYQQRRCS